MATLHAIIPGRSRSWSSVQLACLAKRVGEPVCSSWLTVSMVCVPLPTCILLARIYACKSKVAEVCYQSSALLGNFIFLMF